MYCACLLGIRPLLNHHTRHRQPHIQATNAPRGAITMKSRTWGAFGVHSTAFDLVIPSESDNSSSRWFDLPQTLFSPYSGRVCPGLRTHKCDSLVGAWARHLLLQKSTHRYGMLLDVGTHSLYVCVHTSSSPLPVGRQRERQPPAPGLPTTYVHRDPWRGNPPSRQRLLRN